MTSTDPSSERRVGSAGWTWRIYLLIALGAAAMYWTTAQRGVAWQDSGMHQVRVLDAQYDNPLGIALAHPLLIAMGQPLKLLGRSNVPTALNMLSGLGMALAVANTYLLGRRLTGRHAPAVAAAIMLALCHTAWWVATVTETYCWVAAGLSTELLLLGALLARPRWWILALLALVSGLGLSLHNFALLPLGVYAVAAVTLVVKRRLRLSALPIAAAAWCVGAAGLLALLIAQGAETGQWGQAIHSALFGASWSDDVLAASTSAPVKAAMYIALNWPWVSLAPVAVGWWVMVRRTGGPFVWAIAAVAVIHMAFAVRYPVPDQFMFLLPTYVLFALGAAVGLDRISRLGGRWRGVCLGAVVLSIALTPLVYGLLPPILTRSGYSIRPGRSWPFRDENRYWLTPWKFNEGSARRFAQTALDVAAVDAEILPAGMATPPLQALQRATGYRSDVRILDLDAELAALETDDPAVIANYLASRPVYAIAAEPRPIPPQWLPHVKAELAFPLLTIESKD